jgi:hypothetical protein
MGWMLETHKMRYTEPTYPIRGAKRPVVTLELLALRLVTFLGLHTPDGGTKTTALPCVHGPYITRETYHELDDELRSRVGTGRVIYLWYSR